MKDFIFAVAVAAAIITPLFWWTQNQKEKGDKIIQTIPVTIQHEGDPAAVTLTLELRANRTVTWTNK